MGSFRHYFKRNTHHICIYATLFQTQIYIPSLISGANSKKYKVDVVEPSYYGRCKGVVGGLESVLIKHFYWLKQTIRPILVNNYHTKEVLINRTLL